MGFLVDKVALRLSSSLALQLSLPIITIIPPVFHTGTTGPLEAAVSKDSVSPHSCHLKKKTS